MSNHLAIAAVSSTLVHMLRDPVNATISGSGVKADRPLSAVTKGDVPEVRIFLYGVQPNAAWRNNDLPTRRPNGGMVQRPQAALDLFYLFSFTGNEPALEPQRLLGTVVRELHARPVISRADIRKMIQEGVTADKKFPLATSDLADQPELVRLTPLSLDLEEISKLWSVFFQAPYQLSVAYQASVVLISPDDTVQPSLPVVERQIFADTIRRPSITRVMAEEGPFAPVSTGTEVVIQGTQLRGEKTIVWIGTSNIEPAPNAVGDREIRVTVPASARAGLASVRVEHVTVQGEPPVQRMAGTSNLAPLVVRPGIQRQGDAYRISLLDVRTTGQLRAGTLRIFVDPAVGKGQRVEVILNETNVLSARTPGSYTFRRPGPNGSGASEETHELLVPFQNVPPGNYLVRVQVDGAESMLERDTGEIGETYGHYIAPLVVIS